MRSFRLDLWMTLLILPLMFMAGCSCGDDDDDDDDDDQADDDDGDDDADDDMDDDADDDTGDDDADDDTSDDDTADDDTGDDDTSDDDTGDDDTDTMMLRITPLSPNAPAFDIHFDGEADPTFSNLAYLAEVPYEEFDAGTHAIAITPAGSPIGDAVYTGDVNLPGGTFLSLAIYGVLADLRASVLLDDYSSVESGKVRIRFVHATAGVGEYDLLLVPDAGPNVLLYDDIDLGFISAATEITAQPYTFGFDFSDDLTPEIVIDTPTYLDGEVVNLFALVDSFGAAIVTQYEDSTLTQSRP
ncbi:DUF4397 domain-containing protein [bacterium]|nr:DUF4397 domain-containing protein [bacterium]